MNTKDVLIAARKKIERPECWTKGTYSRDIEGNYTPTQDEKAVCWCSIGATWAVTKKGEYDGSSFEALRAALPKTHEMWDEETHGETRNEVAAFNDAKTTTHADVLALFDRAIAACKEE